MDFKISSIKITGKLQRNIKSHSSRLRGTTPKIYAKKGIYKMQQCWTMLPVMARISHGLTYGGIYSMLPS